MVKYNFSTPEAKILAQPAGPSDPHAALLAIAQALDEGKITDRDAVMLCKPVFLDGILFSSLDIRHLERSRIVREQNGVGVPGAASGRVALTAERAERYIAAKEPFILALPETHPGDIFYIEQAAGLITFKGGVSSHATIMTRQLGKPAVIGAGSLPLENGQIVSIDGLRGLVIEGAVPVLPSEPDMPAVARILAAADGLQSASGHRIRVKAFVDTAGDAKKAKERHAYGIGGIRTEHMFFAPDRLAHMQAMIMAENESQSHAALDKLFPMQKGDFKAIIAEMPGLPVAIRLLDAPLHEFMPSGSHDIAALAKKTGQALPVVEKNLAALAESNPMLGNRAVRLGILRPEIYEMQVRAILEAAAELHGESVDAQVQILIPFVHDEREFFFCKRKIDEIAASMRNKGWEIPAFKVGAMIELPSACLAAGRIAEAADFFGFGTNDLTQAALGLSRDDTTEVIRHYLHMGIYDADPFLSLHPGVIELMTLAMTAGKRSNPRLETSVCGEGDLESIQVCQKLGMDYVCVPLPKIPAARLMSAQLMIMQEMA